MRIDQQIFPSSNPSFRPETTEPHTAPVTGYPVGPYDKQAIEEAIHTMAQPPNLLNYGNQDLDEVIRQDRLDYEAELAYEAALVADLREQRQERYLGNIATIHHLPTLVTQEPLPPSKHLAS